jgi:hypothetical protein
VDAEIEQLVEFWTCLQINLISTVVNTIVKDLWNGAHFYVMGKTVPPQCKYGLAGVGDCHLR